MNWFVLITEIIDLLKGAVSCIVYSSTTAKRLLQPTYDIVQIRNKISDQSLAIGSRVKVHGRFSEYTPFVDMSELLLYKLIAKKDNLTQEQDKEINLCIKGGGVDLVHTCRLDQIGGA